VPAPPDPLFLAFQSAVAGRYSLDRELGRGGMGVVYLANEVDLDRPVAIKLLPPDRAANARLKARFLQEARTSAKLSHPNIIPIHAVDEVGGFVFFAMAYVDGETLAERVRVRGPLPPSEAARVLREVAWALAHAHAHGVVHRDVKPDNILLERGTGRALVADFGIAAAEEGATGEITGTPEFMSPEQALGKTVDARSDLYAFGVTAYYAMSGKLPFHGRTATEVLAKQVNAIPAPLATVAGALPRKLAQTMERCLAKRPSHRPKSAEAVADELGAVLEQRRELPVALRAFVKRGARLDGPGVLIYPLALFGVTAMLGASVLPPLGVLGVLLGGMTVVPLAVLVHRARRLLRLGFGHADLEPAFEAEIERGSEERAVDAGPGHLAAEHALHVLSMLGWGSLAVGLAFGINRDWVFPASAILMMRLGALVGPSALLGSLMLLQQRRDVDAEFYARIWTGPFGQSLFRLARAVTQRRLLPASATHRPTELSIGMAAEQLFADLPKETRQHLGDLPGVIHRLEADARGLRARHEALAEAAAKAVAREPAEGAEGTDTDLVAGRRDEALEAVERERDEVRARLSRTVAALEAVRLSLLRLHAGSGTLESVTTDLGLAFEAAKEVDQLLEARREVDAALEDPRPPVPDPGRP
jgi:eukaryotic-like serine/threonine-protein kinase